MPLIEDGLNPPFAGVKDEAVAESEPLEKKSGQKLLALVRQLEKSSNLEENDYEKAIEDTVEHFNYLISIYSRRGLLQGKVKKAEKILSNLKSRNRERGSKGKANGKRDKTSQDNNTESSRSAAFQQESLIFTALVRILSNTALGSNNHVLDDDWALVIALASELCIAICQYIQRSNDANMCVQAEFELLMESGKSLLSGMVGSLRSIEADIRLYTKSAPSHSSIVSERCLVMMILDHPKHVDPVVSCLKAASSLVSLFGTKLSRSTVLLSDLQRIAWKFLTANEDSIQISAARLIAVLPMAGGTDRMTPSFIWNKSVRDIISMMSAIVHTMAPLNKLSRSSGEGLSEDGRTRLETWVTFVREEISEEDARVLTFHRFLRGLTLCFSSLISRDGLGRHDSFLLVDAKLDVESILEVVENLLAFPLSAETSLYKTKKRLRDEALEGGFISPRAAAILLGNQVKKFGHIVLDSLLQGLGGPKLLPFSTRIIRISYASLLTACSDPLKKVLDPTSGLRLDGKKRRWLHHSIPMRILAVQTVTIVLGLFGNGKREMSTSASSRSDTEKAIALATGCLVEELSKFTDFDEKDSSWGTFQERSTLVVISLKCLQAALASCGGFLTIPIRSMIDSTVLTGLQAMDEHKDVFPSSTAKVNMLELASCCITSPWNDGSCSSLTDFVADVARKHQSDVDTQVCLAARAVLRVCGTTAVPRAPALLYVSRAVAAEGHATESQNPTAQDLMRNIQNARQELTRSEKANETTKKRKADEKRRREEEQDTKSSKRKMGGPHEPAQKDIIVPEGKSPENCDKSSVPALGSSPVLEVDAVERVPAESSGTTQEDPISLDVDEPRATSLVPPTESVDKVQEESTRFQLEPMQDTTESDGDIDFPDIVDGEGPDPDDE